MDEAFVYLILTVHLVIALWLIVRLWRKEASVYKKSAWTLVILVPVVGLFAYGALYKPPPVLPSHMQDHKVRKW